MNARVSLVLRFVFLALIVATYSERSQADEVADFYKSNPISLIVGSPPGGGYDVYSRVLARHMGRHVPGAPAIVVKNMPGVGGARAANAVYNLAPKDGATIVSMQNTLTIDQFTSTDSVKFDMRRFEWLGSMNVYQCVCVFSKAVGPVTGKDVLTRKFILGGSGGGTSSIILIPTLLNHLANAKFHVVKGYEGTNALFLAIERGEAEGMCGVGWDSIRVQVADRLKRGELTVVLDVGINQDPELKSLGVPFALDLIPDSEEKRVLQVILSTQLYGRPFAAPPGTPKERVDALRQAFAKTMEDPAFLQDAAKANVQIQYASPEQVTEYINVPFNAPKRIQERALIELKKAGWGGGS